MHSPLSANAKPTPSKPTTTTQRTSTPSSSSPQNAPKNPDGSSKDLLKPTNFFLTKAPPSPNEFSLKSTTSPHRPILPARSLAPRLDTSKSTPLSAPAGRSPTNKRIGILNRRKTGTPFTRVDPPKFSAPSSGLGFSIDAALSGTIPSYSSRQYDPSSPKELPAKDSWFFDIHEDTEVELATNLLEHSTCTLDISSDEESRARKRDCRGKENVPPPDDVSQTRTSLSSSLVDTAEVESRDVKKRARAARMKREVEEGAIRAPLGDLVVEEFWAEGRDGSSVFLIPSEGVEEGGNVEEVGECAVSFDFVAEVKGMGKEIDIDALMEKDCFGVAPKAALLESIEKAEDGFEVWESGSAKGDE